MKEFLKELTELCKKHNIGIGGCCGSPFLFNINTEEIIAEDLIYSSMKKEYICGEPINENE